MQVELQATCSALGYQEGSRYLKEPDCLESVKDLIRFLKREDDSCDIRRQLGHAGILQADLIQIVKQYADDGALFETVIRLMVNLTQPGILCFGNKIPDDKTLHNFYLEIETHLQDYKQAFVDEELFAVLTKKLGDLLKLDWEHRHEEDRLLIERILILVRNVLHVPPDSEREKRTDDDASIHDQVLWALHVSGMEDLLLYIANSEDERQYCMHTLEIISLMFREQTPEMLAFAGISRSLTEKQKDERELELIREQEKAKKRNNLMHCSSRHSKFGGTFLIKNMKSISEKEVIYHRCVQYIDNMSFDFNKNSQKIPKNRQPLKHMDVVRRSTLSIRLSLKEFCVQFLENCYNPLMYAVKDSLVRKKTQAHDETYYMWAMRFFMEFCRLYNKQVELISETMSVPTFHYIQVNLFNYYEMIMTDKKESLVWAKRVHLALKAYQELLLTLDFMDRSENYQLRESAKVIKSNIFYMTEFRDIFITLLRKFNESKNSRSYLTDLVQTTHLFLRMLKQACNQSSHLVVQKKAKKRHRKKKTREAANVNCHQPTAQDLEDMWDEISSSLSAVLQGREEIQQDVTPFDAASEVDVDQQRVDAMIRIQDVLRDKKTGEAIALFRAAREVWPERNEFGTADMPLEEEFMALREIFMAELPRPTENQDLAAVPIDEEEIEDEEEDIAPIAYIEQEFNFKEYLIKFAKPEIMRCYVLLLADFKKNSVQTNHCCIKMLHQVAVELGLVGMLFQASLFHVFQGIMILSSSQKSAYQEMLRFSTFIVRKFVEVAQKNTKLFMELLFWKNHKEASEIIEGYGSGSKRNKVKQLWTEDQNMELRRLFDEAQAEGKDVMDHILSHITDAKKSRSQILRQLRIVGLIISAKDLKRNRGSVHGGGPWREEQENELQDLFEKFRYSGDPIGNIFHNLTVKRSKAKIMEKILSLKLVQEKKDLYKKRCQKSKNSSISGMTDNKTDEKSLHDFSEETESAKRFSEESEMEETVTAAALPPKEIDQLLRNLVEKGYKDQIAWIREQLMRTAKNRNKSETVFGTPVVPLSEESENAMADSMFLDFLQLIGMSAPIVGQETFWRIPSEMSSAVLQDIAAGLEVGEDGCPCTTEKIKALTQKNAGDTSKEDREKKGLQRKASKHRKVGDTSKKRKDALKALVKKKKENKCQRKRAACTNDDRSAALSQKAVFKNDSALSLTKGLRTRRYISSDSNDSDDEKLVIDLEETADSNKKRAKHSRMIGTDSGECNMNKHRDEEELQDVTESPIDTFPAMSYMVSQDDTEEEDHISVNRLRKRKWVSSDDDDG